MLQVFLTQLLSRAAKPKGFRRSRGRVSWLIKFLHLPLLLDRISFACTHSLLTFESRKHTLIYIISCFIKIKFLQKKNTFHLISSVMKFPTEDPRTFFNYSIQNKGMLTCSWHRAIVAVSTQFKVYPWLNFDRFLQNTILHVKTVLFLYEENLNVK